MTAFILLQKMRLDFKSVEVSANFNKAVIKTLQMQNVKILEALSSKLHVHTSPFLLLYFLKVVSRLFTAGGST
jgi:hypothetical protein